MAGDLVVVMRSDFSRTNHLHGGESIFRTPLIIKVFYTVFLSAGQQNDTVKRAQQ